MPAFAASRELIARQDTPRRRRTVDALSMRQTLPNGDKPQVALRRGSTGGARDRKDAGEAVAAAVGMEG
jgi:hypothetical protein